MENFDAVILGNGATAVAVMQHYCTRPDADVRLLLISEAEDPTGAIFKGVKTVNMIVPKLPELTPRNLQGYQSMVNLLRGATGHLEQIFADNPPYAGQCETGYRVCRSLQELEILQSLQGTGSAVNDALALETIDFVANALGYRIDQNLLFPYEERIWDVERYVDIMADKIPPSRLWDAQKINVEQTEEGIVLEVRFEKGELRKIRTKKLLVCKGSGNIQFETQLRSKVKETTAQLRFKILPFSKLFYDGPGMMPELVSSVMMPLDGVCITNEKRRHSLLFNTNSQPLTATSQNLGAMVRDHHVIHQQLRGAFPALPASYCQAFDCTMTVDPQAYGSDFDRHFQLVRSASVVPGVHYLNLPYFTVIATAVHKLPHNLNDF